MHFDKRSPRYVMDTEESGRRGNEDKGEEVRVMKREPEGEGENGPSVKINQVESEKSLSHIKPTSNHSVH